MSDVRVPLVRAEGVSKVYGTGALRTPVLHSVSLEVRAGELLVAMAPAPQPVEAGL